MTSEAREKRLRLWEEAVGRVTSVEKSDLEVCVHIGNLHLLFPPLSPYVETLIETINKRVGKKIGLLRTDDEEKPLRTRVIE